MPLLCRPMRENQGAPVLPDNVKKAYGHLRRFAMFHMRSNYEYEGNVQFLMEALQAHQQLLDYGKMAEQVGDSVALQVILIQVSAAGGSGTDL